MQKMSTGQIPSKVPAPAKQGSPATHDCNPVGKPAGSAVKGFSGSGVKPAKIKA